MYTMSRKWGRWAGQAADFVRAARLAGDVLATWNGGIPAEFSLRLQYKHGLSERTDELASLENPKPVQKAAWAAPGGMSRHQLERP